MPIEEIKEKLRSLIDSSTNEVLLEDLLLEAQTRSMAADAYEIERLSKEDYEELVLFAKEPSEKSTVSYDELKSSLSKWFTK